MKTEIVLLSPRAAQEYKDLWIFGLKESPMSFSDHYLEVADISLDHYEGLLETSSTNPEQVSVGCRVNSRLVGIVSLFRDQRINARHKGVLKNLYVHSEFRRQGIGRLLMQALLTEAKRMTGLNQIYLWALSKQLLKFYTSFDFSSQGPAVGQDLNINGEWVSAYYMVCRI